MGNSVCSGRICSVVSILLLAATGFAASWSGDFQFSPGRINLDRTIRDGDVFDIVGVRDGSSRQPLDVVFCQEPGKPNLPCWVFTLVIPQGMRVSSLETEARRSVEIGRGLNLMPAQEPVPVSETRLPRMTEQDPGVYGSDLPYPASQAEAGPLGIKSGFRLVTFFLSPLQYHPGTGRLVLATEMSLKVSFESDPSARTEHLTQRQLDLFGGAVKSLVYNRRDVQRYSPQRRMTDFGNIDCVIITSSTLSSHFQDLVDWHNKKGYKTEVRTTSWIYSNYSGNDNQEKIRNFVRDYYNNQGLMWVILGGDNSVVPNRQARAVVGSYTGNIPCDLYYVDLQWSWDADGDSIYGEAGDDTVDLYYDLYVGRASVDNAAECSTFVKKVIRHETNPPTDYLRRILLVDAQLWSGYDETQSNDSIAGITPSGWSDVFFHSPTTTTGVRDSLNHGFQFCHLVGHGNELGVYNGGTRIYGNPVIPGHNNGPRVNLLNSIACYSGNFEYSDCCAEMAHNVDSGGSAAVLMNSRYGWGQPPNLGPSEKLDIRFYDYFFNHDTMPIGLTNAASKEFYRTLAMNQQVWRWCYYELMLFGDPLLMMYESVPASMSLSFTSPIGLGPQNYTVTVRSGGSPVRNALVCLSKGSEVYERGFTNSSGQATLAINPTSSGFLNIFATRADHLPAEDSASVTAGQTDVGVSRLIAPSDTVNIGAVVAPRALIRNYGIQTAIGFDVIMRVGTGYADTLSIDSLSPADTVQLTFANWTASSAGSQAVACTTRLTNDQSNSNDKQTGTVFVQTLDVTCVSIQQPTDTVSLGAVISPLATFRNNGNTRQTFDALFTVSTGYADTQTIALNPSETRQVSFANWTADSLGTFQTACSTRLDGDTLNSNDKATGSVLVEGLDAQAVSIVQPSGTVNRGDTIAPQAVVRNNGNTSQTIPAEFRIGGSYSDSQSVTLAPGAQTTVTFADWVPGTGGTFATVCTTELSGDLDSTNDSVTGSVFVQVLDAQAVQVLQPTGTVTYGSTVAPQATVRNAGNTSQTFDVLFRIAGVYSDTQPVTLAAGSQTTVTFANWTADSLGTFQTACSTRLDRDMDNLGDRATGAVFVQLIDVSCELIVAPTGTHDSSQVWPVQARFRNNGNSTQSFDAAFSITGPSSYHDTVTVSNLMSGQQRLVSFADWTVGPRGAYATACSTRLDGDQDNSNDRAAGSTFVRISDVSCDSVVAPSGTVDSTAQTAVRARFRNLGNTTRTFDAVFQISGPAGWVDTTRISDLTPNEQRTVWFANWPAGPRGIYTSACSTMLAGDVDDSNDQAFGACSVRVRDVGTLVLLAPTGEVDSGAVVTPACSLYNFGTTVESYTVRMKIGAGYDTVASISDHGAGTVLYQTFPDWTADQRGTYAVSCSTGLGTDLNPGNDRILDSVVVRLLDVGPVSVTVPRALEVVNDTILPEANWHNFGNTTVDFQAWILLDDSTGTRVYSESVDVTGLAPAEERAVTGFPQHVLSTSGDWTVRCSTHLAGDMNTANDTIDQGFLVAVPDIGVVEIVWPVRQVEPESPVVPLATFRNEGAVEVGFEARFKIFDRDGNELYVNVAGAHALAPGAETTLAFLEWAGSSEPDQFATSCSCYTTGDVNRANDVVHGSFMVGRWRHGWVEVASVPIQPSGKPVKRGGWMEYNRSSGRMYGQKGYKTNDFYSYDPLTNIWMPLTGMPFRTHPRWSSKPPRKGSKGVSDGGNVIYVTQGNNSLGFWSYHIAEDSWKILEDVPVGMYRKRVKGGTDMVYVPGSPGYVYLLKGYKNEFYRYNTASGEWETLDNAPVGVRLKWDKGSWLCLGPQPEPPDMPVLYAHKAKYHELWRYDLATQQWDSLQLTGMPYIGQTLRRKRSKDGGSAATQDGRIFAFKGGNTQEFWMYDPIADRWTEMDTIPAWGSSGRKKRVKYGADIASFGDGAFIALKGNKTFEVWRYVMPYTAAGSTPVRSGIATTAVKTRAPYGFELRPNPLTRGLATVRYNLAKPGPVAVKVYDVAGRTVQARSLLAGRSGAVSLDLRALAAGIYLVQLDADGFASSQKLVVNH